MADIKIKLSKVDQNDVLGALKQMQQGMEDADKMSESIQSDTGKVIKETIKVADAATSSITKTVNASLKQVKAINKIQDSIGFDKLPQHLRELCLLRLANPEESLDNLTKLMSTKITKSGINHQFRRLIKIAENIEKKEIATNLEQEN